MVEKKWVPFKTSKKNPNLDRGRVVDVLLLAAFLLGRWGKKWRLFSSERCF